jgi:hypothetical protein
MLSEAQDDNEGGWAQLPEPPKPTVGENIPRTIRRPARGIHFAVWPHGHFPAAFLKIFYQLFAGIELRARGLVAVEIADETNPEPDVVHVIAMDMAAAHLVHPTVPDFDLPVPRRSSVADDEMISEPVFHPADVAVIIIEHLRAPLPRAAVVDDDEFPTRPLHRRSPDRVDVRGGEITVIRRLPGKWPPTALDRRWWWRWLEPLFLFDPRLLHRYVRGK